AVPAAVAARRRRRTHPAAVPGSGRTAHRLTTRVGSAAARTPRSGVTMGRIVVEVMPKPEILDPQGKAVAGALPRLGMDGIVSVRQGKRFELEVAGEVDDAALAQARQAAETLLSNPVIEDVVRVAALEGEG